MRISEEEYLKALEVVKAYQKQINEEALRVEGKAKVLPEALEYIPLPVPTFNVLKRFINANFEHTPPLEELVRSFTEEKLSRVIGCGPATLQRIVDTFKQYGVHIPKQ